MHQVNYRCSVNRVWKNGSYAEKALRSSAAWKNKSEEIREASNYLCALCFEEGIYNYKDLEVHHINKLKDEPEKLLDNFNLICLCKAHHKLADAGLIEKDKLLKMAKLRELGTT